MSEYSKAKKKKITPKCLKSTHQSGIEGCRLRGNEADKKRNLEC